MDENHQPKDLVYDGLRYYKTDKNLWKEIQEGRYFLDVVVVALPLDTSGWDFDELGQGPNEVVFNGAIYAKSNTDPADIEDNVLRTIDSSMVYSSHATAQSTAHGQATQSQSNYLQQGNYPQLTGHLPAPQPMLAPIPVPVPIPNLQGGTAPPPLQMPARALRTDTSELDYGFYLPVNQRAGVTFPVPNKNNASVGSNVGRSVVSRQRHPWHVRHENYMRDLVEYGMLLKNRELELKEFKQITEGLVRAFPAPGLPGGSPTFPPRGYNAVHSHFVKRTNVPAFVNRVLPPLAAPGVGHGGAVGHGPAVGHGSAAGYGSGGQGSSSG